MDLWIRVGTSILTSVSSIMQRNLTTIIKQLRMEVFNRNLSMSFAFFNDPNHLPSILTSHGIIQDRPLRDRIDRSGMIVEIFMIVLYPPTHPSPSPSPRAETPILELTHFHSQTRMKDPPSQPRIVEMTRHIRLRRCKINHTPRSHGQGASTLEMTQSTELSCQLSISILSKATASYEQHLCFVGVVNLP